MKLTRVLIGAAATALTMAVAGAQQPPPPQAPPAQTPPAPQPEPAQGRGQGRGRAAVFPAQQRPPGDPALIERGKTIYAVTCSACHGVDLRGGQLGGPNLLRSQLMLNDQQGELLLPVIRGSRADKGMPPMPMNDDDVKAVAEFIHSVQASSRGQGAPPESEAPPPDPVVGDATAGQAYFTANCASCHSPTGDLQGIASRVPDPRALQNLWVSGGLGRGGRGRGGGGAPGPAPKPVTATVTLASGEKVEGELVRFDDFLATLRLLDGTLRSIRRDGDVPKIEIRDPREPHRKLLTVYTDKDMHDVTAYLVTLK
jgi:cytochrome c oxidase cbb3-type subunit 3